jgi:Flp pilus assembly pilin Flp
MSALQAIWTNDDGQDIIEYALLAALVAVAAAAILVNIRGSINNLLTSVNTALTTAS